MTQNTLLCGIQESRQPFAKSYGQPDQKNDFPYDDSPKNHNISAWQT